MCRSHADLRERERERGRERLIERVTTRGIKEDVDECVRSRQKGGCGGVWLLHNVVQQDGDSEDIA